MRDRGSQWAMGAGVLGWMGIKWLVACRFLQRCAAEIGDYVFTGRLPAKGDFVLFVFQRKKKMSRTYILP